MNSFSTSLGAAENLVWILITLLVVSTLINLYFFQNKVLKKPASSKRNDITPDFIKRLIDDQYRKTVNSKDQKNHKNLTQDVIKLRSAYLKIESKSLNYVVDSPEYWETINKQLGKLFNILTKFKENKALSGILEKIELVRNEVINSTTGQTSKEAVLKVLQKFRASCIENSDNPSKIAHYHDTLNNLLKKLDDAQFSHFSKTAGVHKRYKDKSMDSLGNMRRHVHDLESGFEEGGRIMKAVEKYNQNNREFESGIGKYEKDLDEIKSAVNNATSGAVLYVNSAPELKKSMDDFDDISEQIQKENDREIKRLKTLVKNQRLTIAELETAMHEVGKHGDIDIDQLKRSLQEAEICVDILEKELENLKSSAYVPANKNLAVADSSERVSDENIEILESTIDKLENEISEAKKGGKESQILVDFYRESYNAQTVEDVSFLLYQTLSDLDYSPRLLVFNQNRDIEITQAGKISEREKMLIRSMNINEINPNTQQKSMAFRFLNYGGWVQANSKDTQPEQEKLVADLIKNADKIISQVKHLQTNRAHKNKLDQCTNNTKRVAHEIDELLQSHLNRTKESVRYSFGQIQEVSRARGMSASQVAGIKELEKDMLATLSSDEVIRLKTKQKLLKLLRFMED